MGRALALEQEDLLPVASSITIQSGALHVLSAKSRNTTYLEGWMEKQSAPKHQEAEAIGEKNAHIKKFPLVLGTCGSYLYS
jgi:hypothetical protein